MTGVGLLRATAAPMTWLEQAACRGVDPDLFHPERGASFDCAAAKAICADCPVQPECLQYALANKEKNGIWGGASEKERRQMRHDLREAT